MKIDKCRYIDNANSKIKWWHFPCDPVGVLMCNDWKSDFSLLKDYIIEIGNEVKVNNLCFEDDRWFLYSIKNEALFAKNERFYIQKTSWENIDFDNEGSIIFKEVDKYGMG